MIPPFDVSIKPFDASQYRVSSTKNGNSQSARRFALLLCRSNVSNVRKRKVNALSYLSPHQYQSSRAGNQQHRPNALAIELRLNCNHWTQHEHRNCKSLAIELRLNCNAKKMHAEACAPRLTTDPQVNRKRKCRLSLAKDGRATPRNHSCTVTGFG